MPSSRLAIVTGANRGLGLEVCRQLAAQGYRTVLTSRAEAKGRTAADQLKNSGASVVYHPLDVTSQDSVSRLSDFVVREFGRADALINNAAVYIDRERTVADVELAVLHTTIETNVYGPLRLCQAFLPLMRRHKYGRVVNVSTNMSQFANLDGSAPAYRLSKVALNALTLMLARQIQGMNILVNAVSPGWVQTDMGGRGAPRSVEEGADTIVWAATLPDGGPSGQLFRDRKRIEW